MNKLKSFFEPHFFGVCAYLGDKLGMKSSNIRLFFIYSSFLTLGSPILLYLSLAFILNLRNQFKSRKHPIWDL